MRYAKRRPTCCTRRRFSDGLLWRVVKGQVIRVVAMVAAKVGERRPDPEVAERFRWLMEESEARKAMEEAEA